jgi:signal transduction histidine kinase
VRAPRPLRRRLVLANVALATLVAGGTGAGAALAAGRAAEERVRGEISRTAAVVVQGGFLWQREALRQVARFLGAEVATLRPGGAIAVSSARPPRDGVLREALEGLPAGTTERPFVREVRIAGEPATVALVAVPPFDDRLALVYPRHVLAEARAEALLPGLISGGAGLLFAAAAGVLLTRRIVASLGGLLSGLAHEIKNPLAAVRMTAELLLERAESARERDALRLILDEAERLSLFSAKLLAHAKEPAVSPRVVDAAAVARDVARLLARQLEHAGARLALEAPEGTLARADPLALRHVLLNLLLNAMEAQPQGGPVRLSVARAGGGRVAIAVEDAGPGVAPADERRLFEPFFSKKPGGTGLGLSMCRTLARAMGGSIRHERPAAGGARFVLELPGAGG